MSDETKIRRASHAGSWYSSEEATLSEQLEKWIQKAKLTDVSARAIISPHAGYSYSGQAAAFAHKNVDKSKIQRIFVLGPSHHAYLTKCALSSVEYYETPLGNITLDKNVISELYASGSFEWMKKTVDEDEHSIEMQLPFIVKMMEGVSYTLVPVLVGSVSKKSEEHYGALFAKYLDEPENFFVISSDFCHWGKRFDYYYVNPDDGPVFKSIEHLDRRGMDAIESLDPDRFYQYQKTYSNTICGRHPIGVLLQMLNQSKTKHRIKFVHYSQSNQCTSKNDSSVSYAAGVISRA